MAAKLGAINSIALTLHRFSLSTTKLATLSQAEMPVNQTYLKHGLAANSIKA